MQELESQTQHDAESSRDQLTAFEDQLRAERRRREDAEFDLTKQKQVCLDTFQLGHVCTESTV